MKKEFFAVMAFLMAFQAAAFAELISGKVASVDPATSTSSISISTTNAETQAEEKVTVSVKQDTTFSGVQALSELKEGQQVSIEAAKDEASGNWSAKSIEAQAAQEGAAY